MGRCNGPRTEPITAFTKDGEVSAHDVSISSMVYDLHRLDWMDNVPNFQRIVISENKKIISYFQLLEEVSKLANILLSLVVKKGERVMLELATWSWSIIPLSIALASGLFVLKSKLNHL